jgi:hypothetical protein
VDTYAAFCVSVIEYRRAQLHRWFVGTDLGGSAAVVEERRPQVAEDVRQCRAAAWGKFYEVLMICNDDQVVQRARHALDLTKQMKTSPDAESLDALSDQVHEAVRDFAAYAGGTVIKPDQNAPAPPSGWAASRPDARD